MLKLRHVDFTDLQIHLSFTLMISSTDIKSLILLFRCKNLNFLELRKCVIANRIATPKQLFVEILRIRLHAT